jgi:precorrin isomerase
METSMKLFFLACLFFLGSCSTVHDEPFKQVSGKAQDKKIIDQLVQRKASIEEVIKALGQPQRIVKDKEMIESYFYTSVKRRTSFETSLGFRHSESSQEFIESFELIFIDVRLADLKAKSEIKNVP